MEKIIYGRLSSHEHKNSHMKHNVFLDCNFKILFLGRALEAVALLRREVVKLNSRISPPQSISEKLCIEG
jgi:hypothetical protein